MNEFPCILTMDLGKTSAYAIFKGNELQCTESFKVDSLSELYKKISELHEIWKFDLFIVPYPTRFYAVISSHFKMIGVIELFAERHEVTVIESNDARCKKVVLGNGGAKKEDIKAYFDTLGDTYKTMNEHQLDAVLFGMWFNLSQ